MKIVRWWTKDRRGKRTTGAALAFFALISFGVAVQAFPGDVTVVKGLIRMMTGSRINVDGVEYDVAGVPVTRPAGQRQIQGGILSSGDMVEIFLKDGKVISIRNHGLVLQ